MGKLSRYKLGFVIVIIFILIIGLYIAGRGRGSEASLQISDSRNLTKKVTPSPFPSQLAHPIELVREDLSIYLGVPISKIKVKSVEEVIWPDTCLGLPSPELCNRGETLGYKIILNTLDQDYVYHTNRGETFRYAGPGSTPKRP